MVKQAANEKKPSPLLPIFGLLLAVGLLAIAYVITDQVILKSGNYIGGHVLAVIGQASTMYRVAFTVGIWVALLAVAYFLVAVLVGKDPADTNQMPLPPRNKKEKPMRRR